MHFKNFHLHKSSLNGKLTTIRMVIDTAYIWRQGSKDKQSQHLIYHKYGLHQDFSLYLEDECYLVDYYTTDIQLG
jgi:hypothetical protein